MIAQEMLREIRVIVGEELPIATTLDMHANLSSLMLDHTPLHFGFKTYPHVDMHEQGCKAADVIDNAIFLNHLTGYDRKDLYSIKSVTEDFTSQLNQGLEGSTIGIPLTPFFENIQEEVKEAVLKSIVVFEKIGAKIKFIAIPNMPDILEACKVVARSEVYSTNKELALTPNNLLGEQIRERILQGADYDASYYVEAQQIKNKAIHSFDQLLQEVDVIVTPTIPILPPNIGDEEVKINDSMENVRASLIRLTRPTNLIGFPSLTLPCGFSSTGLPIGIQLIGKRFDEANIYRFGYALEQAISIDKTLPML